jgi:hypothetical protein
MVVSTRKSLECGWWSKRIYMMVLTPVSGVEAETQAGKRDEKVPRIRALFQTPTITYTLGEDYRIHVDWRVESSINNG